VVHIKAPNNQYHLREL